MNKAVEALKQQIAHFVASRDQAIDSRARYLEQAREAEAQIESCREVILGLRLALERLEGV